MLLFLGAWTLLLSWEIAGTTGLVLPGLIGWVLWLVALWRVLSRRGWVGRDGVALLRRVWLISALAFAALSAATLFLGEGLPSSWRTALAGMLHVRRVERHYGP